MNGLEKTYGKKWHEPAKIIIARITTQPEEVGVDYYMPSAAVGEADRAVAISANYRIKKLGHAKSTKTFKKLSRTFEKPRIEEHPYVIYEAVAYTALSGAIDNGLRAATLSGRLGTR